MGSQQTMNTSKTAIINPVQVQLILALNAGWLGYWHISHYRLTRHCRTLTHSSRN
ncbi:hypothetical protein BDV09DRAFT_170336 [Aspergillus tetrazonus]